MLGDALPSREAQHRMLGVALSEREAQYRMLGVDLSAREVQYQCASISTSTRLSRMGSRVRGGGRTSTREVRCFV